METIDLNALIQITNKEYYLLLLGAGVGFILAFVAGINTIIDIKNKYFYTKR